MMGPSGLSSDGWEPYGGGESGAVVLRNAAGTRFAKCVGPQGVAELREERERARWLVGAGVPGPAVLDWHVGEHGACLVTSAVPGVPADRLGAAGLRASWNAIAGAVRRLHELPVAGCPFDRGLARMFRHARDVVGRGAVNPGFLPVEQQDTAPAELLERLAPEVPLRIAQEAEDAVVCHGDLCLPNILIDPDGSHVTGFIDLGRLGRADRYADIALLLATAGEIWPGADAEFARLYGIDLDPGRRRFYLHLDPLTWG